MLESIPNLARVAVPCFSKQWAACCCQVEKVADHPSCWHCGRMSHLSPRTDGQENDLFYQVQLLLLRISFEKLTKGIEISG